MGGHSWLVTKTTLKGELVWAKGRPQEPGVYKDPKAKYSPTNVAFGPDGGFYIGDGYGSHYIHQYDKDANWVRTWGGQGTEPGKMRTPHGLWLDNRPGREPARWQPGRFIHPHDACFDHDGNIFVVEWVPVGRVTLLRKVS